MCILLNPFFSQCCVTTDCSPTDFHILCRSRLREPESWSWSCSCTSPDLTLGINATGNADRTITIQLYYTVLRQGRAQNVRHLDSDLHTSSQWRKFCRIERMSVRLQLMSLLMSNWHYYSIGTWFCIIDRCSSVIARQVFELFQPLKPVMYLGLQVLRLIWLLRQWPSLSTNIYGTATVCSVMSEPVWPSGKALGW